MSFFLFLELSTGNYSIMQLSMGSINGILQVSAIDTIPVCHDDILYIYRRVFKIKNFRSSLYFISVLLSPDRNKIRIYFASKTLFCI